MKVKEVFDRYFSELILGNIYDEKIILSSAVGVDNIRRSAFFQIADEQIRIISRKSKQGNFKFTKYKLKLISKGRGKAPREISIPTIRDRIALRALCDFLAEIYSDQISIELPQDTVLRVKKSLEGAQWDGFIKLDISNFYPTIRHQELLSRLRRKIRDDDILELIHSAISTPTVASPKLSDVASNLGVPQGLSVSNILANIYLLNIDKYISTYPNIDYFRYVDDILIFCKFDDAEKISKDIIGRFSRIGLKVHDPIKTPEKSKIGVLSESYEYLGYAFKRNVISVRRGSVDKLKSSLVAIFTAYKNSKNGSKEFLEWRLNIRITGCIFQSKARGWLFYFSQINDEKILHELDHFVSKMKKRFGVSIKQKKFVRAYYETIHKKYETKYIPNFDEYTVGQMRRVLEKYFNYNFYNYTDDMIRHAFRKKIDRQVKDLLVDVQEFS